MYLIFVHTGRAVYYNYNTMLLLMSFEFPDQNASCVEVQLKRYLKADAFLEESLKINCTVKHCGERPAVGWCKIADLDDCIPISKDYQMEVLWRKNNESSSILSLHFKHVTIDDSGLYRCQCQSESEDCISHSINVTVKGKQCLSFSTDFIITVQKLLV